MYRPVHDVGSGSFSLSLGVVLAEPPVLTLKPQVEATSLNRGLGIDPPHDSNEVLFWCIMQFGCIPDIAISIIDYNV